jgi:hypothetical protein
MHPYSLRGALTEIVDVGHRLLTRVAAVRESSGIASTRAQSEVEARLHAALVRARHDIDCGLATVVRSVATGGGEASADAGLARVSTSLYELSQEAAAVSHLPTAAPLGSDSSVSAPFTSLEAFGIDRMGGFDEYSGVNASGELDNYGYGFEGSAGFSSGFSFGGGASDAYPTQYEISSFGQSGLSIAAASDFEPVGPSMDRVAGLTSVVADTMLPMPPYLFDAGYDDAYSPASFGTKSFPAVAGAGSVLAGNEQLTASGDTVSLPYAPALLSSAAPSDGSPPVDVLSLSRPPMLARQNSWTVESVVAAASMSTSKQDALLDGLPIVVVRTMNGVIGMVDDVVRGLGSECQDACVRQTQSTIQHQWAAVQTLALHERRQQTMFMFRDGPLTMAAKQACPVVLEDLDQPNQAVVERANCMLEPNPSFSLTEDISLEGNASVPLLTGFQVFATVHQGAEFQQVAVSPAARSRFTEIYVAPYSDDELQAVLLFELRRLFGACGHDPLGAEAKECTRVLFSAYASLRTLVGRHGGIRGKCEPHHVLRCVDFLGDHKREDVPLAQRLLLAVKVFLVEPIQIPSPMVWAEAFWRDVRAKDGLLYADADAAMVRSLFEDPTDDQCSRLFEVVDAGALGMGTGGMPLLRCVYTGVSAVPRSPVSAAGMASMEAPAAGAGAASSGSAAAPAGAGFVFTLQDVHSRMRCAPTKTFVKNVARIFAASTCVLCAVAVLRLPLQCGCMVPTCICIVGCNRACVSCLCACVFLGSFCQLPSGAGGPTGDREDCCGVRGVSHLGHPV